MIDSIYDIIKRVISQRNSTPLSDDSFDDIKSQIICKINTDPPTSKFLTLISINCLTTSSPSTHTSQSPSKHHPQLPIPQEGTSARTSIFRPRSYTDDSSSHDDLEDPVVLDYELLEYYQISIIRKRQTGVPPQSPNLFQTSSPIRSSPVNHRKAALSLSEFSHAVNSVLHYSPYTRLNHATAAAPTTTTSDKQNSKKLSGTAAATFQKVYTKHSFDFHQTSPYSCFPLEQPYYTYKKVPRLYLTEEYDLVLDIFHTNVNDAHRRQLNQVCTVAVSSQSSTDCDCDECPICTEGDIFPLDRQQQPTQQRSEKSQRSTKQPKRSGKSSSSTRSQQSSSSLFETSGHPPATTAMDYSFYSPVAKTPVKVSKVSENQRMITVQSSPTGTGATTTSYFKKAYSPPLIRKTPSPQNLKFDTKSPCSSTSGFVSISDVKRQQSSLLSISTFETSTSTQASSSSSTPNRTEFNTPKATKSWGSLPTSSSSDSPMPAYWEERKDPKGRKYYVDHLTRSTQWNRPPPSPSSSSSLYSKSKNLRAISQDRSKTFETKTKTTSPSSTTTTTSCSLSIEKQAHSESISGIKNETTSKPTTTNIRNSKITSRRKKYNEQPPPPPTQTSIKMHCDSSSSLIASPCSSSSASQQQLYQHPIDGSPHHLTTCFEQVESSSTSSSSQSPFGQVLINDTEIANDAVSSYFENTSHCSSTTGAQESKNKTSIEKKPETTHETTSIPPPVPFTCIPHALYPIPPKQPTPSSVRVPLSTPIPKLTPPSNKHVKSKHVKKAGESADLQTFDSKFATPLKSSLLLHRQLQHCLTPPPLSFSKSKHNSSPSVSQGTTTTTTASLHAPHLLESPTSQVLDNAHVENGFLFNKKTGLPIRSSPVPYNLNPSISSAFNFTQVPPANTELAVSQRHLSKRKSITTQHFNKHKGPLLSNFTETLLHERLECAQMYDGFYAELSIPGATVNSKIPFRSKIYKTDLDQHSPFCGRIGLRRIRTHSSNAILQGKKSNNTTGGVGSIGSGNGEEFQNKGRSRGDKLLRFPCGNIQLGIFDPAGKIVKIFKVPYDLRDMPPSHRTFIRQVITIKSTGRLLDLVHLRIESNRDGRIFLTDVRVIFSPKFKSSISEDVNDICVVSSCRTAGTNEAIIMPDPRYTAKSEKLSKSKNSSGSRNIHHKNGGGRGGRRSDPTPDTKSRGGKAAAVYGLESPLSKSYDI